MHPAIIIGTVRSLIVDVAMGQIPRSTERISSFVYFLSFFSLAVVKEYPSGTIIRFRALLFAYAYSEPMGLNCFSTATFLFTYRFAQNSQGFFPFPGRFRKCKNFGEGASL